MQSDERVAYENRELQESKVMVFASSIEDDGVLFFTRKLSISAKKGYVIGYVSGKIGVCSDKMESASSKAVVNQLDNPAWPKVSHQARTELNVYRGNEIRKA
jgi:hypothetical protein